MLHDLANGGNFVALKWAAEEREGRRHSERMSKTCWIAKDLTDEAKLPLLPVVRNTEKVIKRQTSI